MNEYIAMIIVALLSSGATLYGSKRNFNISSKEQKEKERSNTTEEWEGLYRSKVEENKELKAEYQATRKSLTGVEKKLFQLELKLDKIEFEHKEKEEGYKIQIDQLTEERDEAIEENIILKEANTVLKNENALLKGVQH